MDVKIRLHAGRGQPLAVTPTPSEESEEIEVTPEMANAGSSAASSLEWEHYPICAAQEVYIAMERVRRAQKAR